MSLLVFENLVKTYNRRKVVNNISLFIKDREVVGLLGPNGAGKTTSFYMAVGLIQPDQGRIILNNHDITKLPMYRRARKGISYLPQEASIFRKFTVEENIRAILETLRLSKDEEKKRLEMLLDELKIKHLRTNRAYSLSGGERRRVEITRLMATNPIFILLDEPFAGIDPLAVSDLQHIIYQLKSRGIGILVSDHNVRETLSICDRAYIVNEGKLLEEGNPENIANSEIVRRIYLGENFKL